MLSAYHSGDMDTAKERLDFVAEIAPQNLSALCNVYANRILDMRANGVPDNWDGVFVATEK